MASNIIDKVHNVTRQSRENRQFSQDFLSNIMQTYSINLTNSSSVPNHSDPPKSPSILSRSPAPKTPMTKNPYAETISHARESSPAKAFYELKQNFFSTQPARSEKIAPEPEPVPVPEVLGTIEAGSAFNKVDKFLENFHRKRDNLNYLEDKIVDDIKNKQASRKNFALSGSDDIDLEALISKVKNNLNKTDKNGTPQKDISSEISKYSPKSKTFQAKTETSPLVNKNQLSPAQGARPKNHFEKALMEIDQSPIKPERDENSHVSFRASFDDKEGEDDDFLVFRSKGKPPQPQPQPQPQVQQIVESKVSDKISGGSKVSLNQSSLPSDSVSFNISESGFNTGQDQRKSRLSEKENVSGDTNIINTSQEKPPLTSTLAKDKKPEKSESPVKKEVQKEVSKPIEPKNEKMIPKAPIMMQRTVKPVYKEVPQEKKETTRSEVIPEKKPQFKNSIKSKIAMLKNIYAGRDANADLPERDTNPNRRSPKQQKRDIYEQESSEEREQKAQERPEILVKDEEEEHKHKDHVENYAALSPQKEEGSLDDLIYSKLTDEKTGTIDDSAVRPRVDSHGHDQNYGDHPLIDMSPMPKRQIDFERASEISFTYSPEDSLIHHHDIGRGRENHTGKKVINPQHVVHKVGKIEWNEQLEREFEAYCDKDPEILKLRSKINYLKGEIALASM